MGKLAKGTQNLYRTPVDGDGLHLASFGINYSVSSPTFDAPFPETMGVFLSPAVGQTLEVVYWGGQTDTISFTGFVDFFLPLRIIQINTAGTTVAAANITLCY